MNYIKKSLSKLNQNKFYDEIDTRLASGWYVDAFENKKKKQFKTQKVTYKISRKKIKYQDKFLRNKMYLENKLN